MDQDLEGEGAGHQRLRSLLLFGFRSWRHTVARVCVFWYLCILARGAPGSVDVSEKRGRFGPRAGRLPFQSAIGFKPYCSSIIEGMLAWKLIRTASCCLDPVV